MQQLVRSLEAKPGANCFLLSRLCSILSLKGLLCNLCPSFKRSEGEIQPPKPSLVAQMVKKMPAVQETQVRSLGWEDPLEEGMATHSSILAWRIPWTEEPGYSPGGLKELHTTSWLTHTDSHHIPDSPRAEDVLGGQVVKTPSSTTGVWVRSLVRELRSHMPRGVARKDSPRAVIFSF